MIRATLPFPLGRHVGDERRRQSSSPRLPSTYSSSTPFGRWQAGRISRAGSPDLGAQAPSLPNSLCSAGDAGRRFRSASLFGRIAA